MFSKFHNYTGSLGDVSVFPITKLAAITHAQKGHGWHTCAMRPFKVSSL